MIMAGLVFPVEVLELIVLGSLSSAGRRVLPVTLAMAVVGTGVAVVPVSAQAVSGPVVPSVGSAQVAAAVGGADVQAGDVADSSLVGVDARAGKSPGGVTVSRVRVKTGAKRVSGVVKWDPRWFGKRKNQFTVNVMAFTAASGTTPVKVAGKTFGSINSLKQPFSLKVGKAGRATVKQSTLLVVTATQKRAGRKKGTFDRAVTGSAYLRGRADRSVQARAGGAPQPRWSILGELASIGLQLTTDTKNSQSKKKKAVPVKPKAKKPGAVMIGANLKNTRANGANLKGAVLAGAYMPGANLAGANLSGAYLGGANLAGANLYGANLYGVYGVPAYYPNGYDYSSWVEDTGQNNTPTPAPAPTPPPTPAACGSVGDTGPGGGTIFYSDAARPEGSQCFEVAPSNWSGVNSDRSFVWAMGAGAGGTCSNIPIVGSDGTAVGAGESNTTAITATPYCDTPAEAPAVWAAKNYTGGTLTDWFLPSLEEMHAVYSSGVPLGLTNPASFNTSSLPSASEMWRYSIHPTVPPISNPRHTAQRSWGAEVRPIRSF